MSPAKGFNEWCERLFPKYGRQVVYVFKDGSGRVLYVGRTSAARFFVRMKEHYSKGGGEGEGHLPWITDVEECETHKLDTVEQAIELERVLIREYKPVFNIQNNEREFYRHHGRFTHDLRPLVPNFGWKRDGKGRWIKP
jgi:hypothetical protein